ncbi:unnamed protein product [Penicillium bialowiezense]
MSPPVKLMGSATAQVVLTDANESSSPTKPPVPRYTLCIFCEKEFDVNLNTEKSCRYHPAEPERSPDLEFDNWDELEEDDEELQEGFPEFYTVECCGGNLKDSPDRCVVDFHREEIPNG